MRKREHKRIFLVVFLISIFLISYIELKNNIQQIKGQYTENQNNETNLITHESQNNIKIDNFDTQNEETLQPILDQNEKENSMNLWKVIERKDSYNNELQFYSKDNVVIDGDTVEIISKKETKENKKYTSGLVESTSVYKYGYFEFTIEISEGKGIFPAIWLLPNEGGALPEIDIFEMIGSEPYTFYGVTHFMKNDIQDSDYIAYKVEKKDKYSVALEWKAESLTWYLDDEKIYTTSKGVPQEYMYIIINQAIGGDWPGKPDGDTIFPNRFKIVSTYIDPIHKKGRG